MIITIVIMPRYYGKREYIKEKLKMDELRDEEYEEWLDELIDKLTPSEIDFILNEMEREER